MKYLQYATVLAAIVGAALSLGFALGRFLDHQTRLRCAQLAAEFETEYKIARIMNADECFMRFQGRWIAEEQMIRGRR